MRDRHRQVAAADPARRPRIGRDARPRLAGIIAAIDADRAAIARTRRACRSRPPAAYNRFGFAGEIARFAWTTTGRPLVSGFQVVPPSTDLKMPPSVPAHTEFSHGP